MKPPRPKPRTDSLSWLTDELTPMTAAEVIDAYASGERGFHRIEANNQDFSNEDLSGASFYGSDLVGANFSGCRLTHVQLKGANLTGASLRRSGANATDMIGANFEGADLRNADLTGASLIRANLVDANLTEVNLGNAGFREAVLDGAILKNARLSSTDLSDVDVSRFCDVAETLTHNSPSAVDARAVMQTYRHPRLKGFMIDCGVPPLFAEFMISCAQATTEGELHSLMQSTFISYGGPDEPFARRLYDALRAHGVTTFYFPESARLGERIDKEIFRQIANHDRVLLVCSRGSLDRPGVIHEITETFDRESRDGGATYLLPITIDRYLFEGWEAKQPELAQRIQRRVIGDFTQALDDPIAFDSSLNRVIDALKSIRP